MSIYFTERKRVGDNTNGLHGGAYGPRDLARRIVDSHRTPSSACQTTQDAWTNSCPQPHGAAGHSVRPSHGHSVGVLAQGNGLRLRNDVLAAPGQVERPWGLAARPRSASGRTQRRGPYRLGSSDCGLIERARCFWGDQTGPNPTDRRKAGSKHHVVTDGNGIPLAVTVTGANQHDVTQLIPLVDAIPPVRGKRGRPRRRPHCVLADRAYDSNPHRDKLLERRMRSLIARRNTKHGSGLGTFRWQVERTISWLHKHRRLCIRYEKRADIHHAFLTLGCICVCFHFVEYFC